MAPWSKHLDANYPCPNFAKDKITLLNMRFCPFAQRAVLVLTAKQIPHDVVNVDLSSKPKWFLERNPLGKVPTVQVGDDVLYESLPVCEYLDSVHLNNPLIAKSPMRATQDKMVLARYDNAITCFYRLIFSKSDRAEHAQKYRESLKFLEDVLTERGSKYFSGNDKPGFLDYMIWPWIERVGVFPKLFQEVSDIIPKEDFPKFNNWRDTMHEDKAVKAYFLDTEIHLDWYVGYKDGIPKYDEYNL